MLVFLRHFLSFVRVPPFSEKGFILARCLYQDINLYSVLIVWSASWLKLKSSHFRKCCEANILRPFAKKLYHGQGRTQGGVGVEPPTW